VELLNPSCDRGKDEEKEVRGKINEEEMNEREQNL